MAETARPVFHLEKVLRARYQPELQDFEGPLDLILFLLGKNRMEIGSLSIAEISGQYLDWLAQRRELDMEVASDFIAMASHLLYLKSRMLLSLGDWA
jgi:segregation and condensation protein A